jgi:hypothetical protein
MAHRTALVAAGSIAVIVVAGVAAVGVNLGILNAADSRPAGKLSASSGARPDASTMVIPSAAAVTTATDRPATSPHKYMIKKVGTFGLEADKRGVRMVDVNPKKGWAWTLRQTSDRRLELTFRRGSSTYVALASLKRHHAVVVRLEHPVTRTVPAASSAAHQPSIAPASQTAAAQAAAQPAAQAVAQPAAAPAKSSSHVESDDEGHDGGSQADD